MKTRNNVKFVEGLAASVLAVFLPIKMVIITTLVLILADLITGVIAAHKRGEKISSAALRRTTSKTLTYLAAICLGYLVEAYMIENVIAVSKLIAGVIGITEIKSVLENLDSINGNSLFKSILEKLGSDNDKPKD